MKQLYRVLPLILSVGIFGCGNSNTPENTANPSQNNNAATNTPQESQEEFVSSLPDSAPVYKVATTGVTPPYSFQDDYGNLQGIDIDAIRAIGETQGFKVEFYKEPWVQMFDTVEAGTRDMALAGIAYTPDRASKYGLSDPYFFSPSALMYKNPDLKIEKLDDIKGLKVGGQGGGKSITQAREMGGYSDLVSEKTIFLLFEKLMQGEYDVVTNSSVVWRYIAKSYPDSKVTIVPYEDENEPSAHQVVLMAKDNTKLIATVNEGIAKLKEEGKFQEIEEKWLGEARPAVSTAVITEQTN